MQPTNILDQVAQKTTNDLVMIFLVVAVVIIVVGVPILRLFLKAKEKEIQAEQSKLSMYVDRESRLVSVIENNSAAISRLTLMIESTERNCTQCKNEQSALMEKVYESQIQVQNTVDKVAAIMIERGHIQ